MKFQKLFFLTLIFVNFASIGAETCEYKVYLRHINNSYHDEYPIRLKKCKTIAEFTALVNFFIPQCLTKLSGKKYNITLAKKNGGPASNVNSISNIYVTVLD